MNDTYQHINLQYLELMTDGDDDMKKVMLDMLLEELPAEMDKMKDLQEEGNCKELKEVSHKMKSTLAFVGNDILTQANSKVESITKTGENMEQLADLISTLQEVYPKAMIELKQELAKI